MTEQSTFPRAIQVETYRNNMLPLPNWDAPLKFYYDESNNIRRLKFTETGLNAPTNKPFVIAGIALKGEFPVDSWNQLRNDMRIQTSVREVKYKHIADSDYEASLSSHRLANLFSWLIKHDIMIHYSVLDLLLWSVLDILESLMIDSRIEIDYCHLELKSELVYAVRLNPDAFLAMLRSYDYPNVARKDTSDFLTDVARFVDQHLPVDRSLVTLMLRRTLREAAKLPNLELLFLHDNTSGELIDDFSVFFLRCVYTFKNSSHTFDRETFVEDVLQNFELREGERRLDYCFAESTDEIGIQVSDVLAGLVGRHFAYLQKHDLPTLRARKAAFTPLQRQCLQLFRKLINDSDAYSPGLLHVLLPWDTIFKNNAFLDDQRVPDFLG